MWQIIRLVRWLAKAIKVGKGSSVRSITKQGLGEIRRESFGALFLFAMRQMETVVECYCSRKD